MHTIKTQGKALQPHSPVFAGSPARDFERPPRTLRWGDFLSAQKVTKEAHRG